MVDIFGGLLKLSQSLKKNPDGYSTAWWSSNREMDSYEGSSTQGHRREPRTGFGLSRLCASGQNETIYTKYLAKKMHAVRDQCY